MTTDTYRRALMHWSRKARKATAEAASAAKARDRLIRVMRADGATLREIAEASGLSEMAISKKCRGLVRGSAAQHEGDDA